MGTIQLWDSRVFSAGALTIAIAVLGLRLPVGTMSSWTGWMSA